MVEDELERRQRYSTGFGAAESEESGGLRLRVCSIRIGSVRG